MTPPGRSSTFVPGEGGPIANKRQWKGYAIAWIVVVAVTCAVGEAVVRFAGHTLVYEPDPELGWKPKANFQSRVTVRDGNGEQYEVDFTTARDGFRSFGDTESGRPRVLFLGDSFTADPSTSNADAFFSVAGRSAPIEVFAIGGGGYGTLQELLLLRRVAAVVKPDALVLQYCSNDILNNSLELEERMGHVRNQKYRRLYDVDGKATFRLSPYHPYLLLHDHSRLFRKLDIEVMKLQYRFGSEPSAPPGARERALATTARLMGAMRAALPPQARRYTISCDTSIPRETQDWLRLAHEAGFEPLASVSGLVEAAARRGEGVRMADGAHWNRGGNRIAGEELGRILAEALAAPGAAR